MNAFNPVSLLLQTLCMTDPFTEGSNKIASFVRKTEERFEPPQFVRSLVNGTAGRKEQEYIFFCLLDISKADFDVLEQAVQLRQLRHLMAKGACDPDALGNNERPVLDTLRQRLHLSTIDQTVHASQAAATWVRRLSEGETLEKNETAALSLLITSEAMALKVRGEWLSDHVDSYDMRAIARLLPLLTVCDEQTCSLKEIGERIGRNDKLGRAVLTFEYAMRTDAFEKWKKKAGKEPPANALIELLQLQRTRLIPVRSLIAVATLSRHLHAPGTPPLTWIRHALESCTSDGFRMDIDGRIDTIKFFLDNCGIVSSGTVVAGSFSGNSFIPWIGTDMLTREKEDDAVEPSPRELVARCMHHDALLLRLLDNPRVFGTPGIIEQIAHTSRSLAVLQKLASVKELYTGNANAGVPLALLKNPSHIPLSLIRPFINARYISLNDMKEILHNPYGIRHEIYSEVKSSMEQRYH
ncbi:MAG: hypothetical protein JW913_14650 [Chitinispirillaceae bacterium]|nr:hypothetical protein [Chitinispirillaceae bacterium]